MVAKIEGADFVEFLKFLDERGWGVLNFNTYRQAGRMWFYLCVAERGPNGRFIKKEGLIESLPTALELIEKEIDKEG